MAAVNQDGNVTAVTPGTATVLVSCVDLDFYAEVNINVVEAATPESAALATPETAAQATPKRQRRRVAELGGQRAPCSGQAACRRATCKSALGRLCNLRVRAAAEQHLELHRLLQSITWRNVLA